MRFGKPAAPLLRHKASFIRENDDLLAVQMRQAALYRSQPPRERCMTCAAPIGGVTFVKLGVGFSLCNRCSHLNGMHADTDAFCDAIYSADAGEAYAINYAEPDKAAYDARVRDIYTPKIDFLFDALRDRGEGPEHLQFADIGAGSGYLLAALAVAGAGNCEGYELSKAQITLAQTMQPDVRLHQHELADVYLVAEKLSADVVTLIGVIEHLQEPRRMLAALKSNARVRYLFLSVPLLSLSVYLELAFPPVMQRHLSGGHTHLYTEKSLQYLCDEFGLERCAEWWFGLDMADFYRAFYIAVGDAAQLILPLLDDLQLSLDKKKLSSEVHMLLRLRA